ncbi:uncharacterized protein LOC132746085 [Ruditapes philippinarum]|uniref:uncharacterized protein LOC132746085 n=1 Tax=Ruditapes philippinarum TaxID=129788 RepID=UPI00295AB0CA|nr:uncharacterized protein LOC132746085 [Ruditapes philippinarum]
MHLVKQMLRNFRYVDVGKDTINTIFKYDEPDPHYYSHIGLHKVRNGRGVIEHMWDNGSPSTFAAWNRDEPSSKGSCTRMSFHLGRYNDTWEVEDCERGLAKYFVCEEGKTDTTISNKQLLPSFCYDNAGIL